jgi:hypothetical protein
VTLDAGAALTLTAVAASTWTFTNKVDWTVGAASTWTFSNNLTINVAKYTITATDDIVITCDDGSWNPKEDGNKYLFLGTTTGPYRWSEIEANAYSIKLYGAGSGSLYLGGAAGLAHSNIYYNGVDGVSITNWTTKGGLTGTGVTAMTIQVPDGSGGTKDIEVLARAL